MSGPGVLRGYRCQLQNLRLRGGEQRGAEPAGRGQSTGGDAGQVPGTHGSDGRKWITLKSLPATSLAGQSSLGGFENEHLYRVSRFPQTKVSSLLCILLDTPVSNTKA